MRILIATDAAREGLNLQAHCWHLFHFDVPWNPSPHGAAQRPHRPQAPGSTEVFCHYFVYLQRPEDRVLQVLVRKTETIRRSWGALPQVVESRLEEMLKGGIRHSNVETLSREIEAADIEQEAKAPFATNSTRLASASRTSACRSMGLGTGWRRLDRGSALTTSTSARRSVRPST